MQPVQGNHLGWVINTRSDPENRQRVQVFIPYLTNTVYRLWNSSFEDISFKNPVELGSDLLTLLQQTLPWAECAMPIFGGASSMKANGTTGVVTVNGGTTFPTEWQASPGAGGSDNILQTIAGLNTSGPWSSIDLARNQFKGGRPSSTPSSRIISLDFNSVNNSNASGALIIIPNNASDSEKQIAKDYVDAVVTFARSNGLSNYGYQSGNVYPGVRTAAANGSGIGGYYHTEPFFSQDQAAVNLFVGNPGAYSSILASTLGRLPGATFINPHEAGGNTGAALTYNGKTYSETAFASEFLQPELEKLKEGGLNSPVDESVKNPESYTGLDSDTSGEGISGEGDINGNATNISRGNATKYNKERNERGSTGDAFNSNNPNIGTFPWVLADLASQRPDLVSGGYIKQITRNDDPVYWDNTRKGWDGPIYTIKKPLYAQFNYGGKTYSALLNDVGSAYGQTTLEGGNRLFDINYNGSLLGQLGIPDNQNLKGVTNFDILGAYNGQPLSTTENGGTGALADSDTIVPYDPDTGQPLAQYDPASADSATMIEPNIPGNQGSQPDTTIAGNGSPNGFFSVPGFGAKVWVFFYDGDVQKPIYFASVVEPSAGATDVTDYNPQALIASGSTSTPSAASGGGDEYAEINTPGYQLPPPQDGDV